LDVTYAWFQHRIQKEWDAVIDSGLQRQLASNRKEVFSPLSIDLDFMASRIYSGDFDDNV
jgi:hypothetical protein